MNGAVTTDRPAVVYPDSDGKPMADNTRQYEWIVTLKGNLDLLYRDRPDVFVAGDHLIYAKKGDLKVRQAPDVYVAFGRPKGHRGSYMVWEEGGVFPQVVFEVLSPGNRATEMARKLTFYDEYGADEYYLYDPDRNRLTGYLRTADGLDDVPDMAGYVSPRLGVRFDLSGPELVVYRPDRRPFLTFLELGERADQAEDRAERAEQERRRAEQGRRQAEQERQRAEQEAARLRALLRAAGIDPDAAGP